MSQASQPPTLLCAWIPVPRPVAQWAARLCVEGQGQPPSWASTGRVGVSGPRAVGDAPQPAGSENKVPLCVSALSSVWVT